MLTNIGTEAEPMTTTRYSTIGAVADRLAIPRWKLAYLIDRGDVPGSSQQVPGRRLFSEADVERIREALSERAKAPTEHA
jgi:DNA-binding transcriptional MerR regulator